MSSASDRGTADAEPAGYFQRAVRRGDEREAESDRCPCLAKCGGSRSDRLSCRRGIRGTGVFRPSRPGKTLTQSSAEFKDALILFVPDGEIDSGVLIEVSVYGRRISVRSNVVGGKRDLIRQSQELFEDMEIVAQLLLKTNEKNIVHPLPQVALVDKPVRI